MYIELIDLLRCPRNHEDSWLVAAFNRMDGRFVIDGKLGCPVCSASYIIADGVANLREENEIDLRNHDLPMPELEDTAMRAAAMLNLTRPGMVVVLVEMDADVAGVVSELTSSRVLVLDPPTRPSTEKENVAAVLSNPRFPFADQSIDGVMLGSGTRHSAVAECARVLKTGGRLVVHTDMPLSGNFRELARDEKYVVAESTGPLLSLSR